MVGVYSISQPDSYSYLATGAIAVRPTCGCLIRQAVYVFFAYYLLLLLQKIIPLLFILTQTSFRHRVIILARALEFSSVNIESFHTIDDSLYEKKSKCRERIGKGAILQFKKTVVWIGQSTLPGPTNLHMRLPYTMRIVTLLTV